MPIPDKPIRKTYLPFPTMGDGSNYFKSTPTDTPKMTKEEYDRQMRDGRQQALTPKMTDFRDRPDVSSPITKPFRTSDIITDPDEKEYYKRAAVAPPDNFIQRNIRTFLPVPDNASTYLVKKASGYGNMNNDDLSYEGKSVLYKTVDNAIKRTGKLNGGTEYEDYNGTMEPDAYKDVLNKVKPGKVGIGTGLYRGATSTGFDMATTVGRMSYAMDPVTHKVIVTDNYDFNNNMTNDKSGAVKKGYMEKSTGDLGVDAYRWLRKDAAESDASAGISDEEKQKRFDKTRSQFSLSPADTIWRKVYPRVP